MLLGQDQVLTTTVENCSGYYMLLCAEVQNILAFFSSEFYKSLSVHMKGNGEMTFKDCDLVLGKCCPYPL